MSSTAPPVLHGIPDAPSRRPGARARGVTRRSYQQHLVAAQCLADIAQAAEEQWSTGDRREAAQPHLDVVAASILSAAAFLEGSVNALVAELQEGGTTNERQHWRRLHARLGLEWPTHELAQTLHKYQLLLSLWDADPFHPRRAPCAQVDQLMRWRDVLVRRSLGPWHRGAYDMAARVPPGEELYADETDRTPTRRLLLNAECAQWAVHSAITFSNEFCLRMNLRPRGFGPTSGKPGAPDPDGSHAEPGGRRDSTRGSAHGGPGELFLGTLPWPQPGGHAHEGRRLPPGSVSSVNALVAGA